MRAFISISIPKEFKGKIKEIQDSLPEFRGKFTQLEDLHVTLKFLGEIREEEVEVVRKKLREINFSKIEAEIDSIGIFSKSFIRIVWIHIANLEKLQEEVDLKLSGMFEKERRFMGHLTIARVKSIRGRALFLEELKKIENIKIGFNIDKFYLMKSDLTKEGPIYTVIEEYALN